MLAASLLSLQKCQELFFELELKHEASRNSLSSAQRQEAPVGLSDDCYELAEQRQAEFQSADNELEERSGGPVGSHRPGQHIGHDFGSVEAVDAQDFEAGVQLLGVLGLLAAELVVLLYLEHKAV